MRGMSNLSSVTGFVSNESQYSIFYNAYNLNSLDSSGGTNSSTNVTDVEQFGDDALSGLELLKFAVQGVGISTTAGLGIIGNILSIIVLSHWRMRSSISFLLIGLAVCDSVILFNSALILGLPTLMHYLGSQDNGSSEAFLRFGHLIPIVVGVAATAVTGSVFFTVAVTMERYLVVCQPFLARKICTWRRAIPWSVGIMTAAALINIPRWWEYTCVTVYNANDNTTVLGCRPVPTELKMNPLYDYYYATVFYLIVQVVAPLACLIFVNGLIYLKIRAANLNRKTLSISEVKENSLTYMLFIIVAIFVICNLVPLYIMIRKLTTGTKHTFPEVEIIGLFLVVFNSAVNFVIYCVYGEKFRNVFLDMLPFSSCKGIRGRAGSDISKSSHISQSQTSNKPSNFQASVRTVCEDV